MCLCLGVGVATCSPLLWHAGRGSALEPRVTFAVKLPLLIESHMYMSIALGGLVHLLHQIQLSATDVSARTTMKGAAKCDKHCELQNSVNQ